MRVETESATDWRALYPFQSHYFPLDGLRYHYLDEGAGQPLLLVHGNPTWSFYWRHLVLALRGKYRLIVPDHIGCGLSGKPQDYPYTLARHVDNLRRLVVGLDLKDITLVAHDWGGAIGLGTAVAEPERFSRLTLLNTAAFRDIEIPWRIRLGHLPILGELAIRGLNGFAGAAVTMATEKPERMTPAVKAGYLAPYDSWANRIATHRFVEDIPRAPEQPSYLKISEIETQLHTLRNLPVCLIWGEKDWCFTPHFRERFQREFFPHAEVHPFADAGHYVAEDAHERIVPILEKFLLQPGGVAPAPSLPSSAPANVLAPLAGEFVNVARRLAHTAKQMPDAIAIAIPRGRQPDNRRIYQTVTFRDLDQESDRLARGLRQWGVPSASRLALMVRPGFEFIALTFALLKAGLVAVLIDPGMGVKNLLKCLDEVEPDGFIGIPPVQAVRWLLSRRYKRARYNVSVGTRLFWDGLTIDELRGPAWSGPELAETLPEHHAAVIFTSGSTGPPKGVLYRHGNFDAQVDLLREKYQIKPGEINLPGFPLFTLFDAAMGVTTVVPDMNPTRPAEVNPAKIIEAIHDWQVTQAFGSPAIWNRVSRYAVKHQLTMPSLRRVLSAGASVPPAVLERLRQCTPATVEIHTPYGATEALPVATVESRVVLEETAAQTKVGAGTCVGGRFPQMDWKVIEIVDGPLATFEQVRELPPGEIGELIVSGPVVTTEYWARPEATATAKIRDGLKFWHRMGDVGYFDAQQRFWFCGRLAQRVRTATGTLHTDPCEAIFNEHPAVFRSALVGIGAPGQQQPVIVIELQPYQPLLPAARTKLFTELRELAQQHDVTRTITQFLIHFKFPVDVRHNAKINREQLALWATKELLSQKK